MTNTSETRKPEYRKPEVATYSERELSEKIQVLGASGGPSPIP